MTRTPRVILENKLYEIVPRAREGLPLPPTKTTNILLKGILARSQRDDKVTLCNINTMNNHDHMHAIPRKAKMFTRFYCEFLKKTTDTIKRLLGFKTLRLWEDRAGVILVEELEDVINRLIYLFCNPTKAGLVDTIDDYPGFNSWKEFCNCPPSVEAEVRIKAPWYPVRALPKLPSSQTLTKKEDDDIVRALENSPDAVPHELVIKPLAWLGIFGITDPKEIEEIRQRVISGVREKEAEYREERKKAGMRCIGAEALQRQPYMKEHTPKEKTRKIFLICGNKDRRKELLKFFKDIFQSCYECYEQVKSGFTANWPPGTFVPWLPPDACCVEGECD